MTPHAAPAVPAARSTPSLSLRRQLLLWLLLPQLVLWAVGGLMAYRIALSAAETSIDQALTQSVRALARQVKPVGSGLLIDFPKAAQDVLEQDPSDRLVYMVSSPPGQFLLGNKRLPQPTTPLGVGEPGHYDAQVDGQPMRIGVIDVAYGEAAPQSLLRVQVGKSLVAQQRIARQLVADMLLPLLLLGGVLSALVYAGVRRGLSPLKKLTDHIERRTVNALTPIGMTQAPSEVHALVSAINDLLTEVQRSVNQEKRFLNDAAHQLRTPLAGLISQAQMAHIEASEPALKARLGKVLTGAERSAHLVHQLLTLARSESLTQSAPLDLAVLARDVAREWTPKALAAGMDLGYEGDDHCPMVGDALQLREAMNNLIDNALRYTPRGSEITLKVQGGPGGATLSVEDNGTGLSDSDRAQVFQRFWRASQQAGGCGLGLSIVQEIARRHGGQAQALARQPQGLRLLLTLPHPTN
jgi:two-component system sensor histidine kinase TctE